MEDKKPSFWDSRDGTWGIVIAVGLITAFVFFHSVIMAGLTVLATTLGVGVAYTIVGLLVLALVHGLFIDGWLMLRYQVFCKAMRQMVVDESPLTILKMWKDKAQERMKQIRSGKDDVKKQEVAIKANCDEFKKDFDQFQARAKQLDGSPERVREFNSACGNMAKAYEMLKKSGERLAMVQKQYRRIDESYKDLEVMYKDMEYEEKCLIRDYETSGALDKVWKNIRSIFKGEGEWDQLRKDAVDSINNKYSERMGRVESAIDDCQDKFDEIKLDREIKESDGLAMFNQLKSVSSDQIISSVNVQSAISYQAQPMSMSQTTQRTFAELLQK